MAKPTNIKIVTAKQSHTLVSPRKANLVLKSMVGRPALLAIKQLSIISKRAADPVSKLIKQAIGNAVSQYQVSPDKLIIDSAFATKGRVLKRAQIGGRGRTKPYEKTAAHMTLNLRVVETVAPTPKKEVKEVKTIVASKSAVKSTTKKSK